MSTCPACGAGLPPLGAHGVMGDWQVVPCCASIVVVTEELEPRLPYPLEFRQMELKTPGKADNLREAQRRQAATTLGHMGVKLDR